MVQHLNQRWIDDIRDEGKTEGSRATSRAVVQAHFGDIPATLEQRIAAADRAALDALTVRAATAASLDVL